MQITQVFPGVRGSAFSILRASGILVLCAMFNKTFYKFLFSFVAVIAGALLFILVLSFTAQPQ